MKSNSQSFIGKMADFFETLPDNDKRCIVAYTNGMADAREMDRESEAKNAKDKSKAQGV